MDRDDRYEGNRVTAMADSSVVVEVMMGIVGVIVTLAFEDEILISSILKKSHVAVHIGWNIVKA